MIRKSVYYTFQIDKDILSLYEQLAYHICNYLEFHLAILWNVSLNIFFQLKFDFSRVKVLQ